MDIWEAVKARHSVRQYLDRSIEEEKRVILDEYIRQCNQQGDLNIQIFYDEPQCFGGARAKYGKFRNVSSYISLVGKKAPDLDERCGYFGEKIVLKAQMIGLNTCWVALTHGKSKAVVKDGEKEVIIISLGYGETQGSNRKSKSQEQISNIADDSPLWFKRGVLSALLAPTAVNQQKFMITRNNDRVSLVSTSKFGPCLKIDLGIVKYHFEIGAGTENFRWA